MSRVREGGPGRGPRQHKRDWEAGGGESSPPYFPPPRDRGLHKREKGVPPRQTLLWAPRGSGGRLAPFPTAAAGSAPPGVPAGLQGSVGEGWTLPAPTHGRAATCLGEQVVRNTPKTSNKRGKRQPKANQHTSPLDRGAGPFQGCQLDKLVQDVGGEGGEASWRQGPSPRLRLGVLGGHSNRSHEAGTTWLRVCTCPSDPCSGPSEPLLRPGSPLEQIHRPGQDGFHGPPESNR